MSAVPRSKKGLHRQAAAAERSPGGAGPCRAYWTTEMKAGSTSTGLGRMPSSPSQTASTL